MALLWIDGFETYGESGSPDASLASKYTISTVSPIGQEIVEGRNGGKALRIGSPPGGLVVTPPLTTNKVLCVGFAFKTTHVDTTLNFLTFRIYDFNGESTGYRGLDLALLSQNLAVYNLTTKLVETTGNLISANTWYHVDIKVYCHDSNGTLLLNLDGSETINLTSNDTNYSSTFNFYSSVGFRCTGVSNKYIDIDDLYICDGTGNTNNDLLGDKRVFTLYPSSDVTGNWTPASGSDKYAMVNGETYNSSNYISANVSGQVQMFEFTDQPITNIAGVKLNTECKLTGNNFLGIKEKTQNGTGNTLTANALPLMQSLYTVRQVFESDADGNTWTNATLNSARFGLET